MKQTTVEQLGIAFREWQREWDNYDGKGRTQPKIFEEFIKPFLEIEKQQERMYSEEDIKLAFEAGHKKGFSGYPNTENWKELPFKEWFEQFKNKKYDTNNKTIL